MPLKVQRPSLGVNLDRSGVSRSDLEEALTGLHVDVGTVGGQAVDQLGPAAAKLDAEQVQDRVGGNPAAHEVCR